MKRIGLTEADARELLTGSEFPDRILRSAAAVAVVLTQSWCPQWAAMDAYLDRWARTEPEDNTIHVYHLEYDRLPFFSQFLSWKENTFRNYDIPYVRFYREGNFVGDSNYIDLPQFQSLLKP